VRVLLVRAGALGDVLLLRPAVAALASAGHRVTLLAPGASGDVLLGPGRSRVERVIPWERADLAPLFVAGAGPAPALAEELAGFEAAVAYTRSEALAGHLRERIQATRVQDPSPPPGARHVSEWLLDAVRHLCAAPLTALLPVEPAPADREAARSVLQRLPPGFLAVHPGSGSPAKSWPPERFAAVVERLSPDRPWLLVEGPADAENAAALARDPRAVVARSLPPRALGAVLASAGLFVGNDSGVSHLAAAWGAPTLALFGPTDPAVWAPLGVLVRTLRSPDLRMGGLTTEAVLDEAGRLTGCGPR
jgi:ADP-heptose:LPS heptosyltransferase